VTGSDNESRGFLRYSTRKIWSTTTSWLQDFWLITSVIDPLLLTAPSSVGMTPLSCQDSQSDILLAGRSTVRDTFFYASDDRDTQLGGLYTSPGITNDNLYSMVEIVCQFSDTFELHDDNGQFVTRDDEQLRPGNYYIVTNGRSLLSLSPSLRTRDRWNLSQFEMPKNIFLVKEEYFPNAINIV